MGTHFDGTPEERRILDAFIKLMRASETISSRLARELATFNLTVSQFGTLESLYHLGTMCQRDIGEKLLKSGGNVTMVVNNLEERGLVERRQNEDDRRFMDVHLTRQGRELLEDVFPQHLAEIVQIFEVITPEEQEELGRLCRKLGRRAASEE